MNWRQITQMFLKKFHFTHKISIFELIRVNLPKNKKIQNAENLDFSTSKAV